MRIPGRRRPAWPVPTRVTGVTSVQTGGQPCLGVVGGSAWDLSGHSALPSYTWTLRLPAV